MNVLSINQSEANLNIFPRPKKSAKLSEIRPSKKKKWELNEIAFDKLLEAFAENRDKAAENYLLLCKNLLRYFEVRGINHSQSAVDEVINRLAKKLESGEQINNINTYALGVARLLTLELHKSPERKMSNDLPELSVSPIKEEKTKHEIELERLDKCLDELTPENRELIKNYYQGERREKIENRKRMAERMGIPQNALRSRAVRLRQKLKIQIEESM